MHRVINDTPKILGTDHIDGNPLNNQKSNLRNATKSQNGMNRKSNRNSSSKYKGISWNKQNKKWRGEIQKNKKRYGLGYFKSEIEAARAYNKKALELFGEYARLNKFERGNTESPSLGRIYK